MRTNIVSALPDAPGLQHIRRILLSDSCIPAYYGNSFCTPGKYYLNAQNIV
jgi:hypothetical protein